MKKLLIGSLGLLVFWGGNPAVQAELKLPSAPREPDLSLDPFERAREAVRRLPAPVEKEPSREAEPRQVEAQEPSIDMAAEVGPGDAFGWEAVATVDWFAKTSGGVPAQENDQGVVEEPASSAMPGLLELAAEVDTGAAGLWDNGTLFGHFMYSFGDSPGDFTGDLHGVSNIDTGGISAAKLLELWYEHSFDHSHSSMLFGMHDFNADFYVAEYAGLFLNGAPGMGTVIGEAAGPPAYPTTAVGVRFRTELTEHSYLMAGIYDGTPTAEDDFFNTSFGPEEGIFNIIEGGLLKGEPGSAGYYKVGVGAWYLKQDIDEMAGLPEVEDGASNPYDFDSIAITRTGVGGVYLLAESSVGDALGLYFKMGRAEQAVTRYPEFYSAGLNYTGLIPGREEDVVGVAVMHTRQSDVFLAANPEEVMDGQSGAFFTAETVFELTYSTQLTDWLMVQPDVQYIQQPGMSPFNGNAILVGLRLQAVY